MSSTRFELIFDPDQTLPGLLAEREFPQVRWWLVAALDSCHEPAVTITGARWADHGARLVPGGGVLLPSPMLQGALQDPSIFCGFDEIWGFSQPRAEIENCPVSIATDRGPVDLTDELIGWLERERPEIGVGDGIGTNIVTLSSGAREGLR